LQISPPLIVDEDELVSIVDGLRAAIEATLPSLGA
jgi:adenosylmethionine-8-amino-7-oxononanoate aminotransferase